MARTPAHGGDDFAVGHEDAHVFERRPRRADEALQIEHAARVLKRRQIAFALDQPQTPALRPEERLHHEWTLAAFAPRDGARLRESLRRESLRRRQSGLRQKKARHGFVGAAFDRARAVDDRDAELFQSVQHAEPHGDRL